MTLPTTTSTIIDHNDYQVTQDIVADVMGLGEDGYGLPILYSNPVTPNERITAYQWNSLNRDLDIITKHLTHTTSTIYDVVTGTSIVTAGYPDLYKAQADYVSDPVRRYICDPREFLVVNDTSTFYTAGTSTRILSWGVSTSTISQEVVASFPTRLAARYYFNLGSYISWFPFHEGGGLNDLDNEWSQWIGYLQATANYKYTRGEFVNYTSTISEYSSGTLSVSILAEKATNEKSVKFTIHYTNNDSAEIIVSPSVGFWNLIA